MAYIPSQYDIDMASERRASQSVDQLVQGIGGLEENRRRMLDEDRRRKQDDLQLAQIGAPAEAVQAFKESGDTSGFAKFFQEQAQAKRDQAARDAYLNRRVKESQISANEAQARERGADFFETKEGKAFKAKEDYKNKNKINGKNAQEFDGRLSNILGEAEQLKTLINDKGTFEAIGPHNQILSQKIDSIAIDAAKLFDPESVARESEVAAFKQMLFEPGSLTTANDTAKGTIDSFITMMNNRAARGKGLVVKEDIAEAPAPTEKSQIQLPPQIQKQLESMTQDQRRALYEQMKAKNSRAAMR